MFINPKQSSDRTNGTGSFYEYYAGFSRSFVRHALDELSIPKGSTILDPWNGAGTTTEAAVAGGLIAHGYDLNPVMALVGKARLLTSTVLESIEPICADILQKSIRRRPRLDHREPLEKWLSPNTAATFRAIELSIQRLLIIANKSQPASGVPNLTNVSSLAAFYYTALFRTLRRTLAPLRGSNPTWLKQVTTLHPEASTREIHGTFMHEVQLLRAALDSNVTVNQCIIANIDVASSTKLPLPDKCIDAAISSPPYCTRLDYAIATSPELSLIGFHDLSLRTLRDSMIGTPTIGTAMPNNSPTWGATCIQFLDRVRTHPSKASTGYYLKIFLNYFGKLNQSLSELARVMAPSAPLVIVVQDSFYKDVHNDLATIFAEMADVNGFTLANRDDFKIGTTLRSINSRSRLYNKNCYATESVLLFQRRQDL